MTGTWQVPVTLATVIYEFSLRYDLISPSHTLTVLIASQTNTMAQTNNEINDNERQSVIAREIVWHENAVEKQIQNKQTQLSLSKSWQVWLGILLTIAALLWLLFKIDWRIAIQALVSANYPLIFTAVFINLLTIPLRAGRWQLAFPRKNPPAIGQLTAAMLIGQTVNIIFPMRLGDLLRATLVNGYTAVFVLGTQSVQFALDLLMMGSMGMILLFKFSVPTWWRNSGETLLLTTAATLSVIIFVILFRNWFIGRLQYAATRWSRWKRIFTLGIPFLRSMDSISQPDRLAASISSSVLLWILYNTVNYLLLIAIGIKPTWSMTMLLLIVLLAGASIPSTPGRFGVYHYIAIQFLLLFNIDGTVAVSFAILQHFITVILPTFIGVLLAWRLNISLSAPPKIKL